MHRNKTFTYRTPEFFESQCLSYSGLPSVNQPRIVNADVKKLRKQWYLPSMCFHLRAVQSNEHVSQLHTSRARVVVSNHIRTSYVIPGFACLVISQNVSNTRMSIDIGTSHSDTSFIKPFHDCYFPFIGDNLSKRTTARFLSCRW